LTGDQPPSEIKGSSTIAFEHGRTMPNQTIEFHGSAFHGLEVFSPDFESLGGRD
jgi:hypothetical protein